MRLRYAGGMIRAMRKRSVLYFSICLLCFLAACAAPGQVAVNTPQGQPAGYPPVIEDSPARRQVAEQAWTRFLAEWRLPETTPELMPVTYTPRSLPPSLAGRINLITKPGLNPKPGKLDELELKEALRRFIEHSAGVLSGSEAPTAMGRKDLSLLSFAGEGNFYRASFRQVNYPVRIAENYGELHFVIGKTGELLQWSSSLLPDVSLPARAEINPETLPERFLNREFTSAGVAGRPQTYRATQAGDIRVGDLIVYPKLMGNRLELHLAYPVTVGNSLSWTVYVDAVNGEELGVKQNFSS